MQTFGPPKDLVGNPDFGLARADARSKLDLAKIDGPITSLISGFAELPHCFTLQSCHGHFVCGPDNEPDNDAPIPDGHIGIVRYRIAYIAMCLENSDRGRTFRDALSSVPSIDPDYIQFGSPAWFWEQHVNSYALQVEPLSQQFCDEVQLEAEEARHVQNIRDLFFEKLAELLAAESHEKTAE
jgi:hypothetical protein